MLWTIGAIVFPALLLSVLAIVAWPVGAILARVGSSYELPRSAQSTQVRHWIKTLSGMKPSLTL
jgi:hypothetical protein